MCACATLRVAGVDRAVLAALDPHLLGGLVAEDDALLRDPDRLEVRPEPGRGRVQVEHARDADADLRRASQLSGDERLKGRVTSTRRMPKMPFCTSTSLMGEPSSGIGAAS
jgi:hypothetical protein